jgi:hypothetical protein
MHPLRKLRESGKPTAAQVRELLAENIVFNSPILVRPIEGREVIAAIFAHSSATRGSGTYTAEFKLDERTTFLRWVGTMDGHKFESLEVIVDNEQGLIVERTIALRPYPALKLFRDAMYASLKDKLRPMFGTTQSRSVTGRVQLRVACRKKDKWRQSGRPGQ